METVKQMAKRNLDRKGALNLTTLGLFIAAGVIAVITLVMSTKTADAGWVEFLHTLDRLQNFIQTLPNKWLIAIAILWVFVLRSIIPIPFPFILIMTGVMFDAHMAVVINIIGCILTFSVMYWFGRLCTGGFALKQLKKYDNVREMLDGRGKTQLSIILATRLVPSIPINMISQIYGGMRFPFVKFLMASLLGFAPKIWVYSVMGGHIAQPFTWKFMGPIICLLIFSGIITFIVNKALENKKRQRLEKGEAEND